MAFARITIPLFRHVGKESHLISSLEYNSIRTVYRNLIPTTRSKRCFTTHNPDEKQSVQNHFIFCSINNPLISCKRAINTSSCVVAMNIRPLKITSRLAAEQLVRDMSEDEREKLSKVLQDLEEELQLEQGFNENKPTFSQLWKLSFINSIPFVGFGFLDNAIMISAGEYIDHTLGLTLGISTMAAAAIGNMISDVAGIGLAGYVEMWATRLGIEEPNLTPLQMTMRSARIASYLGRAIGIVIGCIIGALPLLFIEHNPKQKEKPTD